MANHTQLRTAYAVLSFEQRERFLAEAKESPLGALFQTLVRTGIRPGEAYALRVDELDLRARKVRVERSIELDTLRVKETKTYERREVDLSAALVEVLREHLRTLRARAVKRGWGEPELLFPSAEGTPRDHNNVARAFRRALKAAGLPSFRP